MWEIGKLCWLIGFLCARVGKSVCVRVCVSVWEITALIIWVKASVYYASVIHWEYYSDPCWYPSGFLSSLQGGERRGENRWMKKENKWTREFVCVAVYVGLCVHPHGFSAGSSLIICIFSFELLFAALRAARTPKGLQSNSVKRQVRHKLIIPRLKIIAMAFMCNDVNTHILYKYTIYVQSMRTHMGCSTCKWEGSLNTETQRKIHTSLYRKHLHISLRLRLNLKGEQGLAGKITALVKGEQLLISQTLNRKLF